MNCSKLIRMGAAAAVLGAMTTNAANSDAEPIWASIGAGCVPTGQTSAGSMTFNSSGHTGFAANKTGEVILTCPITAPLSAAGEGTSLTVAYRDPDGLATGARVVVALRRMNKQTGTAETVTQFDSNTRAATTFNVSGELVGSCFFDPFDNDRFFYYVQINMTRSSTALPAAIAAVSLEPLVC